MVQLVIDASVVLKWFFDFPEEGDREKAIKLKNLHVSGKIKLTFPRYAIYEIANALTFSKYKLGEDLILESLDALEDIKIISYDDRRLIKKAVSFALTYNVTIYDALYLILAKKAKCALVTADERFIRKVKKQEPIVCLLANFRV